MCQITVDNSSLIASIIFKSLSESRTLVRVSIMPIQIIDAV